MSFYHKIPNHILCLIPSVYFALLGVFDIVMDVWDGKIHWQFIAFNFIFFLPLIIRHRILYMTLGTIGILAFGYVILVLFVWLNGYMAGKPLKDPIGTFAIGFPFSIISFLMACSLVTAGYYHSSPQKSIQQAV